MIQPKSSKILIVGATGMLGRVVYKYLRARHHNSIMGTSRKSGEGNLVYINIGKTSLDKVFKNNAFGYVVNCIGSLRNSSKRDLIAINSEFPKLLSDASRTYGFKLINISTDAVFSEKSGEVDEDSTPNPSDDYGRSKLEGEILNAINIRTSIIGLDPLKHKGILEFVIKNKNKQITGFTNQKWSGTTTLQLAKFIDWIIFKDKLRSIKKKGNLIHFVPLSSITKHDLVIAFAKLIRAKNVKSGKGRTITRVLTTKYFGKILKMYTENLEIALRELILFDKKYVEKIKKN